MNNRFFLQGVLSAVLFLVIWSSARGDPPEFYLGPGGDPNGDISWQCSNGVILEEFELVAAPYTQLPDYLDVIVGDYVTIDVGQAGVNGVEACARRFKYEVLPGSQYGTCFEENLDSEDSSGDLHSQITFEFFDPVPGAGFWVYDGSDDQRDSIRLIVEDGDGLTWISPVLEAGNGFALAVEGFIGVTSSMGIRKAAVEKIDEFTLAPKAGAFTVDHIQVLGNRSLSADVDILSQAGGTVNFDLDAGSGFGMRHYFLMGTADGTEPGTPLPGGAIMPLNWGAVARFIYNNHDTPAFAGFRDQFDSSGRAAAVLSAPPLPLAVGTILDFAFTTERPYDFQSNTVSVEIVP